MKRILRLFLDNYFGRNNLYSIIVDLVNRKFLIHSKKLNLNTVFKEYESEGRPDYIITVSDEDIRREKIANISNDGWQLNQAALEFSAILRQIITLISDQGTLLFHGSAICVNGRTFIFTGPSGIGKSTHSRLWRQMLKNQDVVMINDDKPFLKAGEGCVTAYDSPWRGKEGLGCNMFAPVEAICSISQGTENVIREAKPDEMYTLFYEQTFRPFDKEGTENHLHNIDVLTRNVRLYKLECDMSLDAARLSYETMAGKFAGSSKKTKD